jgi:hypothetical protein
LERFNRQRTQLSISKKKTGLVSAMAAIVDAKPRITPKHRALYIFDRGALLQRLRQFDTDENRDMNSHTKIRSNTNTCSV